MIRSQVILLALVAFATANGAAIPQQQPLDALSPLAARNNVDTSPSYHTHQANSDAKKGGDNGGSGGNKSKGDNSGNSGPGAVSSALAAAGSASPSVTNDEGVVAMTGKGNDSAAAPQKTSGGGNSGKGKKKNAAAEPKATDASPTAAPGAASVSGSPSALPSPSGTWTWQAGAVGCPDNASASGTKHICSATAVTSLTESGGAAAASASPTSKSTGSQKSTKADSNDRHAHADGKHGHKDGAQHKASKCNDDADDADTTASETAQSSPSPSSAAKTKHHHDQPDPPKVSSNSNSTATDSSSSITTGPASGRVNIPNTGQGRVMIPLNKKRSFEGTLADKQERYRMLKHMNNDINHLKKVLIKQAKKQQQAVEAASAPASTSIKGKKTKHNPAGSFSAKALVYHDLKAVDNQINSLKKTLMKEAEKPVVDGKVVISQDLHNVNDQIDSIRKLLTKGGAHSADHAPVPSVLNKDVVLDLANLNSEISHMQQVLKASADKEAQQQQQQQGPQRTFAAATVSEDKDHFQQVPAATHNAIAASEANADGVDEPRFHVDRENLCSLASVIFALVGLTPLAVLALLRKKGRAVFYGAFAMCVASSLYILWVLENTLVFQHVLPSTFTLAYLSLACLQAIFAALIRTPVLASAPKGYLFLRTTEEGQVHGQQGDEDDGEEGQGELRDVKL